MSTSCETSAAEVEKIAAAFAAERIRQRLADGRARAPDPWCRQLFVALCRRDGLGA